ncbi:hypothetical protein F4779DRAFT_619729 [Xylariaceae sp. FL0662B]|nr:hypothetical protein F4779DRAFT_619729 [Xylariaceae sp. FL0662B]
MANTSHAAKLDELVVTDSKEVIRVSNWVPGHWQGIESETRAHQIIQSRDPGLAPRFLAHITENHSRASLSDLEKCRAALARLHAFGIAKGRLHRNSFLVHDDGSVLIQGPFMGPPGGPWRQ